MKKRKKVDRTNLYTFLFVFFIAIAGLVYMKINTDVSGAVVLVPEQASDSIIIAGINLNEAIGVDVPVITKSHLKTLTGNKIRTDKATSYEQILRLTTSDFTGGQLVYTRDVTDAAGDFLYFDSDYPLFELEWVFSPGLRGKVDSDGTIERLNSETLNMLGKEYMFVDSRVHGTNIELELFGDVGSVLFKDSDVTDDDFTSAVEINGRNIMSDVRIKGITSSDEITITSITYRPGSKSKSYISDVYVSPKRGVKQYLMNPQTLLSRSFDIIYGGFTGVQTTTTSTSTGTHILEFRPSGNDEYRLIFTNAKGQTYVIPLVENVGGSLQFGEGSHDIILTEGSSETDYNIDENDYFMVTSDADINGVTNVLKHNGVDYAGARLFISDLAGGSTIVNFNKATNKGTMVIGGYSYDVYVSPTSPHPITVDVDNDGEISSGEAKLVFLGGGRLDFGSAGNTLNINMIVPGKLFQEGGSGETNTIQITTPGSEVDITVTSPSLQKDKSGYKKAMSDFGIEFIHDDDEPGNLKVYFPRSRKSRPSAIGKPVATSGQLGGIVMITTNREKFLVKNR